MSGDYFLMGNSITDRTNRITLVKLVAQRLGIERGGFVEFYLLDSNVIIRKGEKNYNPNNGRTGFYMGSSVVDKDNRITVIKLVVQNLQIDSRSTINFFLHNEEVVIKKAIIQYDFSTKEIDIESLSGVDKEVISVAIHSFFTEIEKHIVTNETIPSHTKIDEILAAVADKDLRGQSPEKQEFVLKILVQMYHKTLGPEGLSYEDKMIANQFMMMGVKEEDIPDYIAHEKQLMEYLDRLESSNPLLPIAMRRKKILKEMGIEVDDLRHIKKKTKEND